MIQRPSPRNTIAWGVYPIYPECTAAYSQATLVHAGFLMALRMATIDFHPKEGDTQLYTADDSNPSFRVSEYILATHTNHSAPDKAVKAARRRLHSGMDAYEHFGILSVAQSTIETRSLAEVYAEVGRLIVPIVEDTTPNIEQYFPSLIVPRLTGANSQITTAT